MQKVKIFNNLTRSKEEFKPKTSGIVKFYSCGPTTYDFLHVGNARALVVGDLFHRILKSLGYQVTFVRNYTDVDDKIIERANELGVSAIEHANRFVKECERDTEHLGMLPATFTPKVTETMPEIIQMVQELIEKGFAYVVDGEVLYHVPLFKEYGKLSKVQLESLQHGIRVEVDGHKKHPSDFVLWKPAKPGEPSWDSPWGKGRPGWHIECSAMAKKHLGKTIDLHHGGVDLQFPHHENEIAQSEAANSCEFCGTWAHNEFLNFGSEKMSKSLGNVITIRKFVETYSGEVLRHILLSVHYRSKLDWTEEAIEKAVGEMERIHQFTIDLKKAFVGGVIGEELVSDLIVSEERIREELGNDFNVPGAMGVFFGIIKDFNRVSKMGALHTNYAKKLKEIVMLISESTGLVHKDADELLKKLNHTKKNLKGNSGTDDAVVEKLIEERKIARQTKNWTRSDEIRDELNKLGVVVKDNPDGTVNWSYKG